MRRFFAATILALAVAGTGYPQELKVKGAPADGAELIQLANQLEDRDYRNRDDAGKQLYKLGADALPTLRKVVESGSLDAAERAAEWVARIERELANAKATAGTIVELKAEEQTLGAALDSLTKQTGYSFQLVGDRGKKLTPKAGKMCFWEAVQSLIDAAGLEVEPYVAANALRILNPSAKAPADYLGPVKLRPLSTKRANPVGISGGFRIEAIPIPVANLPLMPTNRVPVVLQITPEPRFQWIGTTKTLVAMARDQDGRLLPWDFLSINPPVLNNEFDGRRMRVRGGVRRNPDGYTFVEPPSPEFAATAYQAYVKFLAHPEGASSTLKTFDGLVRGKIWSQVETMLAIPQLTESFQEVQGDEDLTLKAKYDPSPDSASVPLLSVTMAYRGNQVLPFNGSSALNTNPDGLWLTTDTGERAKVILSPEEQKQAVGFTNTLGLVLTDGRGKPMNLLMLNITSGTTQVGGNQLTVVKAQYTVRPADADAESKPAKLTFHGTRIKTVEVPFQLRDVPVPRGTATAQSPADNMQRDILR